MVSGNAAMMTANAFWALIKPQDRKVRERLEVLIRDSLTEGEKQPQERAADKASRLRAALKDIRGRQAGNGDIKVTPFVRSLGADLRLPAGFDEKEAYRRHLEER